MNNLVLIIALVLFALCLLGIVVCMLAIKVYKQEEKIDELERKAKCFEAKLINVEKAPNPSDKPSKYRVEITPYGLKYIDNETNKVTLELKDNG